jgi:hypothetical protein
LCLVSIRRPPLRNDQDRTLAASQDDEYPMLANLLPGLRELRTPLTIGWTWLAALWLAFGELLPPREQAAGIVLSLYQAADVLGDATVLGVVTFIAYLLGSLLEVESGRLKAGPQRIVVVRSGFIDFFFFMGDSLKRDHPKSSPYATLAKKLKFHPEIETSRLAIETGVAVLAQSAELESRLLAEKRDIFDYYDRLKESADLRLNLSGAALALGAAVAFRLYKDGQPEHVIGIACIAALALTYALQIRGWSQFKRSRAALLTAITTGMVKSPLLEEWEVVIKSGPKRQANSSEQRNHTTTESDLSISETESRE